MMLLLTQVISSLDPLDGGPTENAKNLSASLNEREGCSSRLVAIQPQASGNRIVEIIAGLFAAIAATRKSDAVLIHGYYQWWILLLALTAKLAGVRFYITPHGCLTVRQQQYSRNKKLAFEVLAGYWVRHLTTAFLVGSATEAAQLRRRFPSSAVFVGGVGVIRSDTAYVERSLESPLQLLTISRISPKKRIDIAIAAVPLLLEGGIDCHLTIVGDGHHELVEELRSTTEKLGVADRVTFAGWRGNDEKEPYYRASHLFLLPSEDENFGIAPVEALARGLPCVLSRAVASSELMHPEAAVVIEAADPTALSDAVAHVVQGSDAEFKQRQKQAVQSVVDEFDWQIIAARWEILLNTLGQDSRAS